MKKQLLIISLLFVTTTSVAQVFNYGYRELEYKNLLENGICYLKTGDSLFDQSMINALEKHWKISDFTTVEQYKRPPEEKTALFVTTKTKTKKYLVDRKNQHALVLQPAKLYEKDKQVPFDQTLGYMYYNGFHQMLDEKEEYLFNRYMIQTLNKGLTLIKEKQLHNNNQDMNEQIAQLITEEHKGQMNNTLILNRELLVHYVDEEKLKKYGAEVRLFSKEMFLETLQNTKVRTHYIMYYAVNDKTELSLINIVTGEVIYTKHFPEGYEELKAKELKTIAGYF